MKNYTIEITEESMKAVIDPLNLDACHGGFKLIGSKWFNYFEDQIVKVEGENKRSQFTVSKARYYPNSLRAKVYFIIYVKCKKCKDLNFVVKLVKKPELEEPLIFTIEKPSEHDEEMHNTITSRVIRGAERTELAKDLILNHGGSAKAYIETQAGISDSMLPSPSQEVARQCLSEYNNKDNVPFHPQAMNMINNLYNSAITSSVSMKGKTLNGYIHDITIHEKFGMTLLLEEQLDALHCVPVDDRILHFDATGGLVKAKGDGHDYGQILTYGLIAQNIKKLTQGKFLLLGETTTSSHDTESITKMLLTIQAAYGRRYPNDAKLCYMIVLDLAWASIHAACTLNRESFVDYNRRIFRLASGDQSAIMKDKFFLASCASHTMHRFTRAVRIKKIFNKKEFKNEDRDFAIHVFSMMMNCVDLEAISKIFQLLCICLTREYCDEETETAREALVSLINNKPNLSDDIKKRIDKIFNNKTEDSGDTEPKTQETSDTEDSDTDDKADQFETTFFLNPVKTGVNKKTLKTESPFTKHFEDIRKNAETYSPASKSTPTKNPLFNPAYIDFLMNQFMPYCGVWAGFCFVNMTDEDGNALTRITNGIIEKFWSYRKKNIPQALTPVNYSNKTLDKTRGQARIFIKEMKGEEPVSTDSSEDESENDELVEYKHKEGWSKKRKLITQVKKKRVAPGHFQKSSQVFKKTKFDNMPPPSMPPPPPPGSTTQDIDLFDATTSGTSSYAASSFCVPVQVTQPTNRKYFFY